MRVLHVSRFFPPHMGGTERFVASLAAALAARGVESEVVVTDRSRVGPGPVPPVPIVEMPVVGPERFPIIVGGWSLLDRAVRDADIVHLHDIRFGFHAVRRLAKRHRKPVLLTTHGLIFHTEAFSLVKSVLWRTVYRPALRSMEGVVAVSVADEEFCRRAGIDDNLTTIENPVDVAPFLDVTRDPVPGRLLYFGRFSPNKAIERMAGVLRAEEGLTLHLAGRGDAEYRSELDRAFAAFGDRVRFVDAPTDAVLRAELGRCSSVVLPSRHEAFGLTMVEAMAAKVPIVANAIPPYQTLASGTGVELVDFDDPAQVAAAVRRNGTRYDPAPGFRRVADFGWDRGVEPYLALYRAAMEGSVTKGRRGDGR